MWWGVHIVVIMASSTVMWHYEYDHEYRVRMYSVGILVSYIYKLIYRPYQCTAAYSEWENKCWRIKLSTVILSLDYQTHCQSCLLSSSYLFWAQFQSSSSEGKPHRLSVVRGLLSQLFKHCLANLAIMEPPVNLDSRVREEQMEEMGQMVLQPVGPVGPQGMMGMNGTDGEQGPMGPPGVDGRDGVDGRNGSDGSPGPPGTVPDAVIEQLKEEILDQLRRELNLCPGDREEYPASSCKEIHGCNQMAPSAYY